MRLADPELRERLAAEYALGTLRGLARVRLRRRMREDAALARTVAEWEARLAPMSEALEPVQPPERVWKEIETRVGGARAGEIARRGGSAPLLEQLRFWRGLGLVASGACAAFITMTTVLMLNRTELPPTYFAVLSDQKTLQPVLMVSAGRKESTLHVKTLDPSIEVTNASLELWALPKTGKPRSLGLIARGQPLRFALAADQLLADVPTLAVSLEPPGGSRTGSPSGPVLYSGPCVKYW